MEVEEAAKEEGRGAAGDGSVELRLEEGAAPDGADKAKRVIHALVPRRQLDGGGGYIHHGTLSAGASLGTRKRYTVERRRREESGCSSGRQRSVCGA